MKNLIVLGDSFSTYYQFWPTMVAKQLNLNLICYGGGGQPWWAVKCFLNSVSEADIENCEAVIFAHTNSDRIPTSNKTIGKINHSQLNKNNEIELAVALYFKYIHDSDFVHWAHKKWFEEITVRWAHTKIVNLHCFPWTWSQRSALAGINVWPSLTSISLNEINAKEFALFHDSRENHLSIDNNQELANQLVEMINNYMPGDKHLDLSKFHQLTDKWTNWS
jgi:hypothetical protein